MENKNEEFLDINSYEEIEENEQTALDTLSVKELLSEMESIVNKLDAGAHAKKFNQLKSPRLPYLKMIFLVKHVPIPMHWMLKSTIAGIVRLMSHLFHIS